MVWIFLIFVGSLWVLLNYVWKFHSGFLNWWLVLFWALGGIWFFFYCTERAYYTDNLNWFWLGILSVPFFIITTFVIDTQRGMWQGYTAEDWERQDNNTIKFGLKKCPRCFKKLPSYLTTKCPHCTADI